MLKERLAARIGRLVDRAGVPGWATGHRFYPSIDQGSARDAGDVSEWNVLAPATRMQFPHPENIASSSELPADVAKGFSLGFRDVPSLAVEASYTLTIPDGRVLIHRNCYGANFYALVTRSGRSLRVPGTGFLPGHRAAVRSAPKRVDRAAFFLGAWANNYFLWHTTYLCRLARAQSLGLEDCLLMPAASHRKRYVTESMKLLGVDAAFTLDDDAPNIQARELVFVFEQPYRGDQLRSLRLRLGIDDAPPGTRNIFVSRSKAQYRHLEHEAEIEAAVREVGWEVHCMEDYSYGEQIDLMREAKALSGLHGAGFANMLFMPTGSRVLEIAVRQRANPNFYSLASTLGHAYSVLWAETSGVRSDVIYDDAGIDRERFLELAQRIAELPAVSPAAEVPSD